MKTDPLDETMRDSTAMQASFRLSMKEIELVLAGKKKITDLTKLAANTVSNYAKIRSTEVHDKALEIALMRRAMRIPEKAKAAA